MIESVWKIYGGLKMARQETITHVWTRQQAGPYFPQSCNEPNALAVDNRRLSSQESVTETRQVKWERNWRAHDKVIVPVVLWIRNTPHETYEEERLQYKSLAWRGGLEKVWRKRIVSITPRPWEKKTVWVWTFLSLKSSSVPLSAVSVVPAPASSAPRGFSSALPRFVAAPLPEGQTCGESVSLIYRKSNALKYVSERFSSSKLTWKQPTLQKLYTKHYIHKIKSHTKKTDESKAKI